MSKAKRKVARTHLQHLSPNYSAMWKKQRISSLSEEEKEELDTLFGKHFKYSSSITVTPDSTDGRSSDKKVSEETINTPWIEDYISFDNDSQLKWKDESLMTLKYETNELKSQLSNKDIELWHAHTTACNLAGKIIPYVKTLHVELCTQAWVKFYEILSTFKIAPDTNFLSVHLCEAPGAFITALNHYLQQQAFPHAWSWRATTLNPYYEANSPQEMISDDRLFRHTYSHCYFGPDGSGDIRANNHITGLCEMTRALEEEEGVKVLLVTADGSRDCQENPAEQESLLSQLHYCEMIAACLILSPGGNFVLKIFTMFEASSISLLFLLNIMFKEVHAFKPATSKSGNSETYLICLDFQKNVTDETLMKMLRTVLDKNITCFIKQHQISEHFMEEHRNCCQKFAHWQASTIKRNMSLFQLGSDEAVKQVQDLQDAAVDLFIQKTAVTYSRHFKRLACNNREASSFTVMQSNPSFGGRFHQTKGALGYHKGLRGTFFLRQNWRSMSFSERIDLMDLKEYSLPESVLINQCPFEEDDIEDLLILEKAQCFHVIRNSPLCEEGLLNDLNMMFSHSEVSDDQKKNEGDDVKHLAELLVTILTNFEKSEKHNKDHFYRHEQRSHHFPLRQRKSSSSEDVDQQTLSPEWDRHHTSWSCSLSSSPTKTSFSFGSSSESPGQSDVHKERNFFSVIEEEEEKDSLFFKTLNSTMSPSTSPISVINLKMETDGTSLSKNDSYFFMDLTYLSHAHQVKENNSDFKELLSKSSSLNKILWALQHIPIGSNLILLSSTLLTRFSAGLVYILARCFHTTRIQSCPNLWLCHFLILEDFYGANEAIFKHLSDAGSVLEEGEQDREKSYTLVEFITFRHILNDGKFVTFFTSHNNYLLASFINIILKNHKQS